MKTKLLKKTRKRFEISHLPNGFVLNGRIFDYNLFLLEDATNEYYQVYAQLGRSENKQFCDEVFETEKECISYLKDTIIWRLKKEGHKNRKMKTIHTKKTLVWYK